MDLDTAVNASQILSVVISVVVPVSLAFFAWKRTLDRRDEEQAKRVALIQLKLDMIEKQFGPNGGGLREAVNRMSSMMEKMDNRMIELMKEHSELVGRAQLWTPPEK